MTCNIFLLTVILTTRIFLPNLGGRQGRVKRRNLKNTSKKEKETSGGAGAGDDDE